MPTFGSGFVAGAFEGPVGDVGAAISRGPGSFDSGANPFGVPILQTLDNLLGAMHLLPTDIAARINPHTDDALTTFGADFVTPLQGDVDAIKATTVDGGFGTLKQGLDNANSTLASLHDVSASDVWNAIVFSTTGGDTNAAAALGQLWAFSQIVFQSGFRSAMEPWFVFRAKGEADFFARPNLNPSFLGFGDPSGQGESETDLAYMNRVSGGLTWHSDWYGTGHVGATFNSGGFDWDLWYWPLPSSGGITEPAFVEGMLAVKPTEWADLVEGGLSMADALSAPWRIGLSGAVEAKRYTGAAHFLVVQHKVADGTGVMEPTGAQALLHPMNISPGAQLPTETDVEFLNRISAGGLTWEWKSGANSIAYATDTADGMVEEYYYSPLDRFPNAQRMLVYTPNSGPPDRSLWEDAVALMSRLPISFE